MNLRARVVILADDLSGAADCAAPFTRAGQDVLVAFGPEYVSDAHVVAIDLDTRRMTEEDARATATAAVERLADAGGAILYKKIDSTLRGHIAAELGATCRALTPRPLTIFAPAFPAMGRTTRGGRVFINETPLEETETWRHSGAGRTSDLVHFLKPSGLRVERVAIEEIRGDASKLATMLLVRWEAGVDVFVCDATEEADLRALAHSMTRMQDVRVLFVGSAGLASHLAAPLSHARERPPLRVPRPGPVVFLVGSVSSVSRGQLDTLAQRAGIVPVVLSPELLLGDAGGKGWRWAESEIRTRISGGPDVAITTATEANADPSAGGPLALALGRLLAGFRDQIGALVITGGETARAVLTAMDIHSLDLRAEVEPGVALGVARGEHLIPVATKAGGFGRPETFLRCREILHEVLRS
jgi:uncharacterized protein YgbK (DUF1537 family)